jgi:6-phosphogluconolactonase
LVNIRILRSLAAALLIASTARGADYLVYAGTYTSGSSHGIYGYRFDTRGGKLKTLGLMAETSNPSFLLEHPDHRFLYAVNEDTGNSVSAFLIDPKSGKLSLVNKAASKGDGPCHLALDRGGRWLAVANYGSGSVAVLPLRKDGGLGEAQAFVQHHGSSANPQRQAGPHAHSVLFSPDNRFLLAADLGADKIFVYRFDPGTGSLTPADPPFATVAPGSGVRHLAFHPNGAVLYAINELSSSVTAFRYDPASGALAEFQTVSTLPPSHAGGNTAAEIAVNAAGTMVYGSNRGHESMALLAIDPLRFTLSALEFTPLIGRTPRHFAIDPTGGYLIVANQDAGSITVYSVHPRSGQLRPVGRPTPNIDLPACVVFVPMQTGD